jgi:sec-independent protein translocase protein TatC
MLNPDSDLQQTLTEYSPYFLDLFKRIYVVTIFFSASFVVGFFLSAPIIKFFTEFFDFKDVVLIATSPFQIVNLAMDTGIFFACIFTIPLALYHFYAFIIGGLKTKEKGIIFSLLPVIFCLFIFGFIYSFCILYFTMQTLANLNVSLGVKNLWDISTFLSQLISTSALLGLIFEFPIVMTFIIKLKVITVQFLKDKRRHAIFLMFVLTSLLPPTDGISLVLMVLPLVVMYEATIMYNRLSSRHLI